MSMSVLRVCRMIRRASSAVVKSVPSISWLTSVTAFSIPPVRSVSAEETSADAEKSPSAIATSPGASSWGLVVKLSDAAIVASAERPETEVATVADMP
ncbi:hypothetical protein T484DRAFT_1938502 [Baffinella frigidus]|nr:hypothetical protein T484DRAFT_1938502 [Cryptophyta sp. CCMP2293]